ASARSSAASSARFARWPSDHLATAYSCACAAPSQRSASSGEANGAPASRWLRSRWRAMRWPCMVLRLPRAPGPSHPGPPADDVDVEVRRAQQAVQPDPEREEHLGRARGGDVAQVDHVAALPAEPLLEPHGDLHLA